jgi:hypothetical protein
MSALHIADTIIAATIALMAIAMIAYHIVLFIQATGTNQHWSAQISRAIVTTTTLSGRAQLWSVVGAVAFSWVLHHFNLPYTALVNLANLAVYLVLINTTMYLGSSLRSSTTR